MKKLSLLVIISAFASCNSGINRQSDSSDGFADSNSKLVDLSLNSDERFEQTVKPVPNRFNDTLSEIISFVIGKFNTDSVADTAYLMQPSAYRYTINRKGRIDSVKNTFLFVRFSCNLPYLVISHTYEGIIIKVDDIDNNGIDELLFEPEWVQSCWSRVDLYRFHGGFWKKSFTAPFYRCGNNYTPRIEKDNSGLITLYSNAEKIDTTITANDTLISYQGVEERPYRFRLD
ncbi:MAG: hypothetical protein H7321_08160 [Bacteroidia bacterium]|nr:hypothetical protein [Bacteroidia bacterium]